MAVLVAATHAAPQQKNAEMGSGGLGVDPRDKPTHDGWTAAQLS